MATISALWIRRSISDTTQAASAAQVHPVGYRPAPSAYDQVAPGHFVLAS
jgi:hypothetical protein